MKDQRKKIVVELSEEKMRFFEKYAREKGMSITELIDLYIEELQQSKNGNNSSPMHFAGIVPDSIKVMQSYQDYLLEKYQ